MTALVVVTPDFTQFVDPAEFLRTSASEDGMQMLIANKDWWAVTQLFDAQGLLPVGQMVRDALLLRDGDTVSFWYKFGPEL